MTFHFNIGRKTLREILTQMSKLADQISVLAVAVDDLKGRAARRESELLSALDMKTQEAVSLGVENASLKAETESLRGEIENLKTEVEDLKTSPDVVTPEDLSKLQEITSTVGGIFPAS